MLAHRVRTEDKVYVDETNKGEYLLGKLKKKRDETTNEDELNELDWAIGLAEELAKETDYDKIKEKNKEVEKKVVPVLEAPSDNQHHHHQENELEQYVDKVAESAAKSAGYRDVPWNGIIYVALII